MKYNSGQFFVEETSDWVRTYKILGFESGDKISDSEYEISIGRTLEKSNSYRREELHNHETNLATDTVSVDWIEPKLRGEGTMHDWHVIDSLDEVECIQ